MCTTSDAEFDEVVLEVRKLFNLRKLTQLSLELVHIICIDSDCPHSGLLSTFMLPSMFELTGSETLMLATLAMPICLRISW